MQYLIVFLIIQIFVFIIEYNLDYKLNPITLFNDWHIYIVKYTCIMSLILVIYYIVKLSLILMFYYDKDYIIPNYYPNTIKNWLSELQETTNMDIETKNSFVKFYLKLILLYSLIFIVNILALIYTF